MNEIIERVGRAIDPDAWETQDGLLEYSPDYWASPFETERRTALITRARAAIAAMREPTVEMWEVGCAALEGPDAGYAAVCWQAMIDAALEPAPASDTTPIVTKD